MTRKESIRIEYKPLSTSDSVATLSGNQRQAYDVNSGYFNPDRRLDPLTLLVTCAVMDAHNLVNGGVNESLTDVSWKITDPTTGKLVPILATDKQFKIGAGADKGKITIYKNIPDLEETTIEFTARYIEPKSKRVAVFQRTFSLVTVTEATAPALLKLTAPVGTVQFPFVNDKGLVLQADLLREGKKVPSAYYWKKDGKDLTEKTDKLVVTDATKAGNVFQVEVADCTAKFNELVADKVEADAEVKEWRGLYENEPENLLDKSLKGFVSPWDAWDRTSVMNKKFKFQNINANYITISKRGNNNVNAIHRFINIPIKNKIYSLGVLARISPLSDKSESGMALYITSYSFLRITKDWTWVFISQMVTGNSSIHIRQQDEDVDIDVAFMSLSVGDNIKKWSPAKLDMQELLKQKTDLYADQTSLPAGYRPNTKPTTLYKKEMFLKRSLGDYEVEILYPKVVDPDADAVQFEAVFTNNRGSIPNSEKYLDVGWWKKADGSYEYKGLKIKVPMDKLQTFIAAGRGVEYTVIEK